MKTKNILLRPKIRNKKIILAIFILLILILSIAIAFKYQLPPSKSLTATSADSKPEGPVVPIPGYCTYLSGTKRYMGERMDISSCTKKDYWLVFCSEINNTKIDWTNIGSGAIRDSDICNINTNALPSPYFTQTINRRSEIINGVNDGDITENDKRDLITLEAAEVLGYSCAVSSAGTKPEQNNNLTKKPLINFLHGKAIWEVSSKYNIMISNLKTKTSDPATSCQPFPPDCGVYNENGTIDRGDASDENTVNLTQITGQPHEYGLAFDINCKEPKVPKGGACGTKTNTVLGKVKNKGFTIIQECTTNTIGVCSGGNNQIIHLDLLNRTTKPYYTFGGTNKIYYNCDFNTHSNQ